VSGQTAVCLRIGLLHFSYWPEVQRGSERIIHDLATDLAARGHHPHIITSHPGRPSRTVEALVPITRHWRPPEVLLRKRNIEEHLSHLPFSYLSLRGSGADLAHAFLPSDALAAIRWSQRTGRPSIFAHMGVPRREVSTTRRLRKEILEYATSRSDAVVVLSKAAQEGMWRWLGVESRVIYPGVDLARFEPDGERDEQPLVVCAAAVEDARKRIDLLVRAFRLARRDRPALRLLLQKPGDPRLREDLQREVEGIEYFDPGVDTAPLFRRAWVSALASHHEAFGLVLVESLACGTPVVAARDGGVPEIVDRPEVGRLFHGDDESAVARALLEGLELAQSPSTAGSCRERATAFSTENTTTRYEELYRELLGSSHRSR